MPVFEGALSGFGALPDHIDGGGAISQSLINRRLVPVSEGKHTGLDADERVIFFPFLHERREPSPHRHLRAFAHVTEEVLLDGDIRDLLVMKGFSDEAQYFRRSFGKSHDGFFSLWTCHSGNISFCFWLKGGPAQSRIADSRA